jgi:hypothetical protein
MLSERQGGWGVSRYHDRADGRLGVNRPADATSDQCNPPATIFPEGVCSVVSLIGSDSRNGSRTGRKVAGGERRGRETTRSRPHRSGGGAHYDRGPALASVSDRRQHRGRPGASQGPREFSTGPAAELAKTSLLWNCSADRFSSVSSAAVILDPVAWKLRNRKYRSVQRFAVPPS